MANRNDKTPRNVPGPYYVDRTCIDCDLCRSSAPDVFMRDEESGLTYVHHQPDTPTNLALAAEAKFSCPSDSIGDDGEPPSIETSTPSGCRTNVET